MARRTPPKTCAPFRHPWQMPAHRWAARFLGSFCWSITRLYAKRIGVFLKNSPPERHRFDVFGGTSIYEIILVDFAEAMEHVAYEKRFQMNSRLHGGRHAIMLDWDRITQAQLEEWIRNEGGRWHVYKTEQGFHFICASRTVSYWQLLGLLYRARFHKKDGLNIILIRGYVGVRVSRKERSGPDIYKVGVFGEGGELPEVAELIALHDELIGKFHGPAAKI